MFTETRDNDICDIWLFKQDFDISDVVLQENETTDAKYATKEEIRQMDFDRYCHNLDAFDVGDDIIEVDTTDFRMADFEHHIKIAQVLLRSCGFYPYTNR